MVFAGLGLFVVHSRRRCVMIFRELYSAIESMCYSMESLCVHALNGIKKSKSMDDEELLLFSTLPAFPSGSINILTLNALFPFTANKQIRQQLSHLAKNQLVTTTDQDHYFLTEQGDQLTAWMAKEMNNALAGVLPLPATSMMDMASQLKEIDDACYAAVEPPRKLHLTVQRKLTPAGTIPMMARINQITKELIAYRNDAHYSAWQAYGVDGHSWEILTLLWQGKKLNVDILHHSLTQRGFSLEDTFASISELSRRGWVINSNEDLSITPFGAEIRHIAEDTTDRYYFAPWQDFPESHLAPLLELIDDFRRGIPTIE
jgi:hypothetical protein